MKQLIGAITLLLLLGSVGVMVGSASMHTDPVLLTTTTSIVHDLIVELTADLNVEITQIIPTGVDPHDFEPTPGDISTINNSDHIFWIGGGAEESLQELLEQKEVDGLATALIETIAETDLIEGGHEEEETDEEHGTYDPHFWMDPVLWQQTITAVENVLVDLFPDTQNVIETNVESYNTELTTLHQDAVERVADLDEDRRYLVTQHSSLQYYANRYNFTLKTLQGISTDAETGVREIDALAEYIVDNDIEVVFIESTTSADTMEAVLEASRAQGHQVVLGGELYVGSLSSDDTADTYIMMMNYNTNTIVNAILNPPEPTAEVLSITPISLVLLIAIPLLRRRPHE